MEGVARKVALTATHDLLKAGGVVPQVLSKLHERFLCLQHLLLGRLTYCIPLY